MYWYSLCKVYGYIFISLIVYLIMDQYFNLSLKHFFVKLLSLIWDDQAWKLVSKIARGATIEHEDP